MVINTLAEILSVRNLLSDAGVQMTEVIYNELRRSSLIDTVFVRTQLHSVTGVYLSTDSGHTGTNYYSGAATFNIYTGELTLDNNLPDPNTRVLCCYTFFKGLTADVIDQHIVFAKGYINDYAGETFDWTDTTTERTQIAKAAMTVKAAMISLAFMIAPEIIQKGYNFRLEELSVESKTWAGSMGLRDMLDMWNKMLQEHLNVLGMDLKFEDNIAYDFAYRMDNEGNVT